MSGFGWPTLRYILWVFGLLGLVVLINYFIHSIYAAALFLVWYGVVWVLGFTSVNRHKDKVRFNHETGEWEHRND